MKGKFPNVKIVSVQYVSGAMLGAVTQNPIGIGRCTVDSAVKALNGEKLPKIIDLASIGTTRPTSQIRRSRRFCTTEDLGPSSLLFGRSVNSALQCDAKLRGYMRAELKHTRRRSGNRAPGNISTHMRLGPLSRAKLDMSDPRAKFGPSSIKRSPAPAAVSRG
jgi:hypothetical protein